MAVPTFVQCKLTNSTRAPGSFPFTAFHFMLPELVLANNCVILAFVYNINSGTPTIAITDDQSNSWGAATVSADDATNNMHMKVWVLPNVPAGTHAVVLTLTGGDGGYGQLFCAEEYNVATASVVDGAPSSINSSGTTTWAPGSITTTVDGDVIYTFVKDSGGLGPYTNFTPGTGATLLVADSFNGFAIQRQVQATAGAITPGITAPGGATGAFIACGIALKAAAAGTAPTAVPRILKEVWLNAADGTATSFNQQFPTLGDAIHVGWVGAPGVAATPRPMTNVTDTAGNSYAVTPGVGGIQSGTANHAYSLATQPNAANRVTISVLADNLSTAVIHDVLGGGLYYDRIANANGLQADGGNLTTVSIVPSVPGGIVFVATGINAGALRDLIGTGYQTEHPWTPEEDGGANQLREDNGWGHTKPTDLTTKTFTYAHSRTGVGNGAQDWASQALSLIPTPPRAYTYDFSTFPKPPLQQVQR